MASTWRSRGPSLRKNLFRRGEANSTVELSVPFPVHFRCPVSLELMKDPVIVSTGITYDRQSIETWLENGNVTCPVTKQPFSNHDLIPNHSTRKMIQDWCVANRSHGVQRIPTPKVPISPVAVSKILSEIASKSRSGDHVRCRELAAKVKTIAKESERNRRCFTSNGAGQVLAKSFDTFARSGVQCVAVLEEILLALPETFPLNVESCNYLISRDSLSSIASILKHGSLAGRLNAVLALREAIHPEKAGASDTASWTEGLLEALVKLIKEPVSPTATKSTLVVAFYMVSSNERVATMFAEMGMAHLLVDLLVDSEKSTSEKALGVLDGICSSRLGVEMVHGHALAVPLLMKKMFRVSDVATEFAVSVLWKICRRWEERCLDEALQVGAFQKLLLLLQVGCGEKTKEKATELLKLLNAHKGTMDCFDPVDLKGLKRSF